MNFGSKIVKLRKQKGLNRDDLGKIVGSSGAMIGKYERNQMTPSVEMAKKIAEALGISLDYLTGSTSFIINDKKMLYRLKLLDKVSKEQRDTILGVMDSLLQTYQLSSTQQKLVHS